MRLGEFIVVVLAIAGFVSVLVLFLCWVAWMIECGQRDKQRSNLGPGFDFDATGGTRRR